METTEAAFTAAIRQAVAEKGEGYLYPEDERDDRGDCQYFTDEGEPSCLIGYALHILDPDWRPEHNTVALILLGDMGFPRSVASAAYAAQDAQDHDGTWGNALAGYERVLADYQGDRND